MVAGQRLRKARQNVGLTQEQLAIKVGVKPSEISQYEKDKRTPRWQVFNKLLDELNVTADEILGRDVIVRDSEDYEIRLSKEDLQILSNIKSNPKLYNLLLKDPERNIQMLTNNLKYVIPEIDK